MLAITSCGDDGAVVDAPVDVTTVDDAMLAIDRTTHPFGSVLVGESSPAATFQIRNSGGTATGILAATLAGADAASYSLSMNGCTAPLAAGATCDVSVVFTPASSGAKAATLQVTGTPGGTVSASLDGEGIAFGALSVATSVNALGSVVVGGTGAIVSTFTVTNTGTGATGALTVTAAGSDPVDFLKANDQCAGQTLAAAASCTFTVRIRPLSAGAKSALFTISAGPGGTVSGSVTGTGLAPASLVVIPQHRSFGSVVTGQASSPLSLLVVNTGGVESGAIGHVITNAEFAPTAATTCTGVQLGAGTNCVIVLAFTPAATGTRTGQISITGAPGGTAAATLAGIGIAPGGLTVSPTAHAFANTNVGGTAASLAVTVTNTGATASGALVTSIGGTHASQFRVIAGTDLCNGTALAAGASCTISVTFAPTAGGSAQATLSVASATDAVTTGLSGIGVSTASLAIVPPSRAFGSVATGSQSAPLAFTVTNLGGQASGVPTAALTGADAGQFMIAGNGCTLALGPNASCTIQVRFVPTAVGDATAALSVMATPGGTLSAALTGSGVAPGGLLVIPSAMPFPPTAIGDTAAAQTLSIINTGTAATGTIALSASGDFALTANDCTTLAAGASCTATTTFTPTATGPRTGSLTATATPGGAASAALSGVGRARIEIIALNLGPVFDPFDFGTAVVNTTVPQDLRITVRNNTSSQKPLTLTDTFGGQYSVVSNTCSVTNTIESEGTCVVNVRFRPTSTGAKLASITFAIGSGATNQVTQNVTGTGTESLTLTALSGTGFGSIPINTTSSAQSFRVTNPAGSITSGALATTLTGTGFAIVADACDGQVLTGGASCLIDINFAPGTTTGPATATLTVTATPGGMPSLMLTATGVDPIGSAPTDIDLMPSSIAEDAPAGSTVGMLSTTDADVGDTFAFTLVGGAGSTDNSAFVIAGTSLQTVGPLDAETKSSYAIRVRVTDGGGNLLEEALTVTVTNVDEAPVAVDDTLTVLEDAAATAIDVLANDTDIDAGPRMIASITQPPNGAVVITGGGTGLTYQPNANYDGTDTFSYTLNGGSIANVNVTITAVDDAPVAVDDALTVIEDSIATAIDVLANDTDIDGGPLAVEAVTQPASGAVTFTASGVVYTPGLNFTGADSFTYTLNGGSIGTVSLTVTPVDDLPVAVADEVTVLEDSGPTTIQVLVNDLDVDGGPIMVTSVTQPVNGTVVLGTGGLVVTYQPNPDYFNSPPDGFGDRFTYTLNGGSTIHVIVHVTGEDDLPVAVADTATVTEDDAATAIDVLANDTDIDGGPITISSFDDTNTSGTIVITGGGTGLTYQPDADYCNDPPATTLDTFTYTLNMAAGAPQTTTVTVTVTCVDDPPTATDDVATVLEDAAPTAVLVLANDADVDDGPKTIASVTQPVNGTVVLTGPPGAATGLTYEPDLGYCNDPPGTSLDTFTYTLAGGGVPDTATVSITVTCVDDAPVAVSDAATVAEDSGANAIDVLANDTDTDGGPKSVASVTQPANGAVVISGGGTGLTYAPNANYCNTPPGTTLDTFTYTLNGGSSTTVTVTVTCSDDNPVAVNDGATVAEDAGASAVAVLANDTDVDGGPRSITSVTQPANGAVAITGGGTGLTYQPNANYCNAPPSTTLDTFTYTLTPGGSTATVAMTVTCVDDLPVAVNDTATVAEDAVATAIDVLANDTDVDAGPKSVASVTQPANGAVVITGGGTGLTYAPNASYCNTPPGTTPDTFTYTLNGGSIATVSVAVTCLDDPPVAVSDSATVVEDSGANAIDVLANDTDADGGAISVASVTQPANGTVVITGGGTGLTYAPNANYCNTPPGTTPDTFTYTLTPGSSSTTVSVAVTCVDDNPTAVADSATVSEDSGANAVPVLANDTDPDGGSISVTSVTQPASGTVVITGGGTGVTYAPNANFCTTGTPDSFTYTLTPGGSSATVSMTVTCVDDNPAAVNDAATVTEDSVANAIDVLANDTDADGGPKSVTSVTQPANGAVTITGGGTGVSYTPNANYCNNPPGTMLESFTYTLTPGGSSATVSVSVTCVDDPPIAVGDAATVVEDSGASAVPVLANDTDTDGGPKSVASVTQPANGTVAITGGGTGLSYAPNADYCNNPPGTTPDTFTYTLNGGSVGMVAMTVTCVNDAPLATGYTGLEAQAGIPITFAAGKLFGTDNAIETAAGSVVSVVTTPDSVCTDCQLTINSNGSFTFTPPPGAAGTTVSFTYHVIDTGVPAPGVASTPATVSFAVAAPAIYFVKQTAVGAGTCSLGSECTLATALSKIGVTSNKRIYITDALSYAEAVPLNLGGWIVGQDVTGVTFDTLFGITPPSAMGAGTLAARPVFAPGSPPVINNTITIATNAVVRGLTVSSTTSTGITDPVAAITGFSITETSIVTTTGTALNLSSATGVATFKSISTMGAASAILLDDLGTTTVTISAGAIVNATTRGVDINSGTGSFTMAGTISTTGASGRAVEVTNHGGGTVIFNGAITDTGGINLATNTGTTFHFNGGLDIDATTNTGFSATGGGTVNAIGTNTIDTTTGIGLSVVNTTIGASHLTFRNVSSSGASSGIVLNNTGASGSLRVVGTGAAGSGGTIQSSTGTAISLTSTLAPQFDRMTISGSGGRGVGGTGVAGFTFTNSTISNSGTAAGGQYLESNIGFNDAGAFTTSSLSGAVTITGNTLSTARRHGIQIENGSGTISSLTISTNTISSSTVDTSSLGHGILILTQGSASTAAHLTTGTISTNVIENFPSGSGVFVGGGTGNATNVTSSVLGANGTPISITGNTIRGTAGSKMGNNAIAVTFNGQVGVSNFTITNNGTALNPLTHFQGLGISVFMGGTVTGTTTVTGNVIVSNQTLAAGSSGIAVQADDGPAGAGTSAADINVTISNNSVSATEGFGIRAIARASLAKLDATIQNNTVTAPTMTNRNGIRVDSGSSTGDTTVCLLMTGNTSAGSGVNAGMGIRKQGTVATTNDFGIVGLAPSPTTGANAAAKITADNAAGGGTDAVSGDNYVSCTLTP